jgi:hypothetical protein
MHGMALGRRRVPGGNATNQDPDALAEIVPDGNDSRESGANPSDSFHTGTIPAGSDAPSSLAFPGGTQRQAEP